VQDVATSLRHRFVYRGQYSAFRGRPHGRPADDVAATRFIGFAQNHDQVGNRARGERSSVLMSPAGLHIAAALVCLAPFVPMLFEGEEWGATAPFQYFTDHTDPELGRAVTDGRRHEFSTFGWQPEDVPDPQDVSTWEASHLRWAERDEPPHAELLEWYRGLLRLRRETEDLTDGGAGAEVATDDAACTLVLRRGTIVIALHAAGGPACVSLPSRSEPVLAWPPGAVRLDDGGARFDGEGVIVVRAAP
jgi:maltooligosyltrehalose trehalohydrolase